MEECYAKSQLEYNFYLGVELLTKSWPSLLFRIGTLYKELSTELLIYYFVYIDDIHWWQGIFIHLPIIWSSWGHEFQIVLIIILLSSISSSTNFHIYLYGKIFSTSSSYRLTYLMKKMFMSLPFFSLEVNKMELGPKKPGSA